MVEIQPSAAVRARGRAVERSPFDRAAAMGDAWARPERVRCVVIKDDGRRLARPAEEVAHARAAPTPDEHALPELGSR
ncbi:hypothetical protein HED48_22460 [Ochrobactrum intermedium]|nr:hypothetical protein [Brucella intermedia]